MQNPQKIRVSGDKNLSVSRSIRSRLTRNIPMITCTYNYFTELALKLLHLTSNYLR
jgi:hypothetical protein